jgi:hypothetical protein
MTHAITRRLQVLSATAKELEFIAHSFCSTAEGYQTRVLSQVSAVKLLKNEKVWGNGVVDDEEFEDASEVVSVLRRISSAARKGKQKVS